MRLGLREAGAILAAVAVSAAGAVAVATQEDGSASSGARAPTATAPAGTATATPAPVAAPVVQPREMGTLIGLTASELRTRLGAPRLTVQEGQGTKLQWLGAACVLDAYLYPAGGQPKVTHVDARDRSGRDIPQANCLAVLQPR